MRREPFARRGLALVRVAQGQMEAQIIKSRLESEGIPVVLDYEPIGAIFGLTVNGLGEVRVLVPAEEAQAARSALGEAREA